MQLFQTKHIPTRKSRFAPPQVKSSAFGAVA